MFMSVVINGSADLVLFAERQLVTGSMDARSAAADCDPRNQPHSINPVPRMAQGQRHRLKYISSNVIYLMQK